VSSPTHSDLLPDSCDQSRFLTSALVSFQGVTSGVTSEIDIGLSGGAADPSRVRLVRDGKVTVIDMRPLDIRAEVLALQVQSGDWLYVPRASSSRLREEVTFWGSVVSTLLTVATLIVLITR
jgi:hypothetical protein